MVLHSRNCGILSTGLAVSSRRNDGIKQAGILSRLIVLKNNQPAAIILSPSEFQRLSEIEEDYTLLLETTRRLKEDSSSTSSREDVMSELGISEADLAAAGDVVME